MITSNRIGEHVVPTYPPLDLRLVHTFTHVVECGSLNAASVELGYAQSTVTQHIQQLEGQLGVLLFDRHGKRISITEAGAALFKSAVNLLRRAQDLQQCIAGFASGENGSVRVGCVEPFVNLYLPSLLRGFMCQSQTPAIEVEVDVQAGLYRSLTSTALDLIVAPPSRDHDSISFEPMYFESLGFLIPRSHRLSNHREVTPADLVNEHLILSGSDAMRRAIAGFFTGESRQSRSCLTITTIEGRKAAAQAGLGIAIVPIAGVRPLPADTVFARPRGRVVGVTIGIARRSDDEQSPAVRRFHGMLREVFPRPEAWMSRSLLAETS